MTIVPGTGNQNTSRHGGYLIHGFPAAVGWSKFRMRVTDNKNASFEQTGRARVAAGEVAFPMHIHIGGTHTIEVIDLMVFDDDGLITSMRAFWSTDENQEGT